MCSRVEIFCRLVAGAVIDIVPKSPEFEIASVNVVICSTLSDAHTTETVDTNIIIIIAATKLYMRVILFFIL